MIVEQTFLDALGHTTQHADDQFAALLAHSMQGFEAVDDLLLCVVAHRTGVEEYGVGYIKMDYNIDAGIGTEVNSDSFGDGLLQHNRAYLNWIDEIKAKYADINADNIEKIIKDEIGIVFSKVLEDAGVFKRDEKGQAAFVKFIEYVNR